MKFQIVEAATGVFVEPTTYYPTYAEARAAVKRIASEVPALAGKMTIRLVRVVGEGEGLD